MKFMGRADGHHHLNQFNKKDFTTWNKDMDDLLEIKFAGISEVGKTVVKGLNVQPGPE